jgi:SprT protein
MKEEKSVNYLEHFLPPGTFEDVAPFFKAHIIHLSLTRERKSVLGDYRPPSRDVPHHRISINANLNPYNFLITLLHELAHLFTFQQYGRAAAPHGAEWKASFRQVLIPFIAKKCFPPDVEKALKAYVENPAASTCTDPRLFKALYRYDDRKPGHKLVDHLATGTIFETDDGTAYQVVEKVRSRTKCRQLKSGKMYLFPGIMEVKEVGPTQ